MHRGPSTIKISPNPAVPSRPVLLGLVSPDVSTIMQATLFVAIFKLAVRARGQAIHGRQPCMACPTCPRRRSRSSLPLSCPAVCPAPPCIGASGGTGAQDRRDQPRRAHVPRGRGARLLAAHLWSRHEKRRRVRRLLRLLLQLSPLRRPRARSIPANPRLCAHARSHARTHARTHPRTHTLARTLFFSTLPALHLRLVCCVRVEAGVSSFKSRRLADPRRCGSFSATWRNATSAGCARCAPPRPISPHGWPPSPHLAPRPPQSCVWTRALCPSGSSGGGGAYEYYTTPPGLRAHVLDGIRGVADRHSAFWLARSSALALVQFQGEAPVPRTCARARCVAPNADLT